VANAVKEILNALKKPNQQIGEVLKEVIRVNPEPTRKSESKNHYRIFISSGTYSGGIFLYP